MTTPAKPVKPKSVKEEASREAKRMAAILLDVLAGSRTPTQAAETLGVSLPRYYQLESRGLDGLLMACEPRPRGRQTSSKAADETLRRDNERLRRELSRQQSLVRLTQRTLGVAPPVPVKPTGKQLIDRGKLSIADSNGAIFAVRVEPAGVAGRST